MNQTRYSQRTSCLVVIINPILILVLLLIEILILSLSVGSLEYASLNCNRLESEPQICQLIRFQYIWPLPTVENFVVTQLEAAAMESSRSGGRPSYRPTIQVSGQLVPLTHTYIGGPGSKGSDEISRIQAFIDNSETKSLSVKIQPSVSDFLSSLFFFIVLFIPTLPILIFIIAFTYGFCTHLKNLT